MKPLLPILALTTGCFYVDPINQRPSIDIISSTAATLYRGGAVALTANENDPDGQVVAFHWRIYACTDATTPEGCDQSPYDESSDHDITFRIPVLREDLHVVATSLRVKLEAFDDHGAYAKPDQTLVIPLGDQPPTLEVRKSARNRYVTQTPVDLFAKYGDPDEPKEGLTIGWTVFSPSQGALSDLEDASADPTDPQHVQIAKKFTPHAAGAWDIEVTVSDTLGTATTAHIPVDVVPDAPPCIAQYQPAAPLDLASPALPINVATLFSVPVVTDDLDPAPATFSDPVMGIAKFAWSLKRPDASAFAPLGVTANAVVLDPAAYTVGDQLELRVEIADRNPTTLTCPLTDLTCAVVAGSSCIQRLTWRVEVR